MKSSDGGTESERVILSRDVELFRLNAVVDLGQDSNQRLDRLVRGVGGLLSRRGVVTRLVVRVASIDAGHTGVDELASNRAKGCERVKQTFSSQLSRSKKCRVDLLPPAFSAYENPTPVGWLKKMKWLNSVHE